MALRRQKTTFLRELINMRSEVGRQPGENAFGPLAELTLGDQAAKLLPPTSGQGMPNQPQLGSTHGLNRPKLMFPNKRALGSESTTPWTGAAAEGGPADVIYSLNLGQQRDSKTQELAGVRPGSGGDGG